VSEQQLHSALNECGIDHGTLWRIQNPSRLGRGQTTSHAGALFRVTDEYARRSKRDSCQCNRQPIFAGRMRVARIRPVWVRLTNIVCPAPLQNPNAIADSSRYYVLVAACVFARNVKWLRKACLAATLLFPAVAALHGIVLAAVPTDGK
jgi:hypothetical protein